MDEAGAAAVDDVGAGGDEVGGVPYADVVGVFCFEGFSMGEFGGEFAGDESHVWRGEDCSFRNCGWQSESRVGGRCDGDVAIVGFSEGAEDENQLISNS